MEKRQKKWKMFTGLLFLMMLGAGFGTGRVQAASASFSFSAETDSIAVGEEISMNIQVEADSQIASVEGYMSYDSSILEYLAGADGISGGGGTLKLSDTLSEDGVEEKSYQMTFRAKKKGSCILEFSEQPVVYEAGTEEAMSVSYGDISVKVTKAKILSNNVRLDSLQVSPGTLEPSFAKNVREYKVYVEADTERITVSALPSDSEASVSVRGNESLLAGENLVVVTVEAPSGKRRKYKIYVQKEVSEPEEKPEEETDTGAVEPEKEDAGKQKKESGDTFQIVEKNGGVTLKNKTVYTLVPLEDSSRIPSGYVKTKLILYGVTVTGYTLENDLENDFILMYAKKKGEEPQFYQYDRAEKTMQRFSGMISSSGSTKIVVGEGEKELSIDEYNQKVQKLSIIVGISAALVILFALGMLSFAIKYYSSKVGKVDDLYR